MTMKIRASWLVAGVRVFMVGGEADGGEDGAGRENVGERSEGQAGGGGEGFLRVLHGGAGEGGRFETRGAIRDVRQPADVAGRRAGGAGRQLDGPLRDAGNLFAAERDSAADGAASEERLGAAYPDRLLKRQKPTCIETLHFAGGGSGRFQFAMSGGGAFQFAGGAAVVHDEVQEE